MIVNFEYLLTDGNRDKMEAVDETELRYFLHNHKTDLDSMTVELDDGRKYTYERQKGWTELDTPF